jgi:diguanylate cyclase (GGDEF)-like protein/PAS domain S-box-containing protein
MPRSELYQAVLDGMGDALILVEARSHAVLGSNRAAREMFGYTETEMGRLGLSALFPAAGGGTHADLLNAFGRASADHVLLEIQARTKMGEPFWVEVGLRATEGPSSPSVVCIIRDIRERKRCEESLQENALQDSLTGLPNRVLLADRLARNLDLAKRRGEYKFAVLLLDLDRFKLVNESLGHAAGDRLLLDVARRLSACVKQSDTVARTGGDEFVALLEDLESPADATRVAERILQELSRSFLVDGRELFVGASVGIVIGPSGASEPSHLLRDAETAMYRSKSEQKTRYTVFDPEMHEQATETLQLETDLRLALVRGELVVYYQPIVSIHTSEIIGSEALVRWKHPGRGLVSPATFIPLAEETGLIVPLDDWVIREACRQNREWQQAGHRRMSVSVNVTGRQFRSLDLFFRIERLLKDTGLDARSMKVEVTENVTARDAELAIGTLGRLREMGVQVLIDDFGTGYSSLSQLKRMPIDVLKIDRQFVRDISKDTGSAALISTVILMAHALGFEVIAEGVETPMQLEQLRRHNCDYAQGYLFSPPVPAEQFENLLNLGVWPEK